MTIFSLNATQLESVLVTVQALNDLEKNLDMILEGNPDDKKLGEGHLAMPESPIRIVTDAYDWGLPEPEVLGWIERDEQGWNFTQTDPATKK